MPSQRRQEKEAERSLLVVAVRPSYGALEASLLVQQQQELLVETTLPRSRSSVAKLYELGLISNDDILNSAILCQPHVRK